MPERSKLTIRKAPTPLEVAKRYGVTIKLPATAWVGEVDGEIVGAGGLLWGIQGRCWLWFHTEPDRGTYPFAVRTMARKLLRHAEALGETAVYVTRDPAYATSEKLMQVLGAEKTGETLYDQEVWVWRFSQE